MRLYSRTNATAIDDPAYGHFEPGEHGGFDLPDELADHLHSFHQRKRPLWETDIERDERLHGEESARQRDPQTLYAAVAELLGIAKQAGRSEAAQEAAPAKTKAAAAK